MHHSWIVDPSVHSRVFTMYVGSRGHRQTDRQSLSGAEQLTLHYRIVTIIPRRQPDLFPRLCYEWKCINLSLWRPTPYIYLLVVIRMRIRIDIIQQPISTYVLTGRRPNSLFSPHSLRGWPKSGQWWSSRQVPERGNGNGRNPLKSIQRPYFNILLKKLNERKIDV